MIENDFCDGWGSDYTDRRSWEVQKVMGRINSPSKSLSVVTSEYDHIRETTLEGGGGGQSVISFVWSATSEVIVDFWQMDPRQRAAVPKDLKKSGYLGNDITLGKQNMLPVGEIICYYDNNYE